jgi:hypothetical protein
MFDVVIAALVLGRARRQVLVGGEGAPRNAPAAHAHGFLVREETEDEQGDYRHEEP